MKKTRLPLIALLFALFVAFSSQAATVVIKISQFPNVSAPNGNDLFLLASTTTNKNISWNQLRDAIGTNPATVTIISNAFITNLFAQFITNNTLYSTNVYTTNLFTSNLFATNIYTSNLYSTNLYTSNLFSTNVYTSNLYATNITVNEFHGKTCLLYTSDAA